MSGFSKGQRVRITTGATVISMHQKTRGGPMYKIELDLANGESADEFDRDELWVRARDLEPFEKQLVVLEAGEEWREVCADAIRERDDHTAVALLVGHAPTGTWAMRFPQVSGPYIKALEDLADAFGKFSAVIWQRDLSLTPSRSAAFEKVNDAWHAVKKLQGAE